jgi:hypothetical protein
MILLKSTDSLRLVTGSTADVDVAAFFGDLASGAVTPGNQASTIASAATTTIVSAPSASTYRTVRFLSIRNRHASTSNTVTVQFYDGSTAYEIKKVALAAGQELIYDEANGWQYVNAQGLVQQANALGAMAPASSSMNTVVLSSDVTNNNVTANTIADVTGLSFSVTAGSTYWFRFVIPYTSAATTTGSRWSVSGPTATSLYYTSRYTLTATAETVNYVSAYDSPASSNASSLTASNVAVIEGFVTPSANGTLIARFASEITLSAIVAKAGATCWWQQVI